MCGQLWFIVLPPSHICPGNPDEQYVSVVDRRKGKVGKGEVEAAVIDAFLVRRADIPSHCMYVLTVKC